MVVWAPIPHRLNPPTCISMQIVNGSGKATAALESAWFCAYPDHREQLQQFRDR